jgi:hypothetical protein
MGTTEQMEGVRDAARSNLDEVVASIRELGKSTRDLGTAATEVAEREISMAIDISEGIVSRVLSIDAIGRTRNEGLPARLRKDVHRAVDVAADLGFVVTSGVADFVTGMTS